MEKFDWKSYWQPTPTLYRKIGDAILVFGSTLTATFAGAEAPPGLIIASVIFTATGKMVTNFFTEV